LLETLGPLALLWKWVVLDVVRPREPIEELEPSLVQDLLVECPNGLFVGGLSV
jgi:hypothetical protein